ncbi:hypothetical protein J2I47_07705 [Fibrella sp. HMF5335]|uniref:Uncharacterized protein n=1 Tax=Fibrella rubiginis TaxID=2817060 RepID=A0A939K2L1_9BACT|nr:hypothetical protein [Fibrella rubiginis]MBO0936429.1 hypothetical protein [Fibrella rubiginis]
MGRGGRTQKKQEEQVSEVVKTTLTLDALEKLQAEYKRETAGQKVSFAEFIRQRLTMGSRSQEREVQRAAALALQLELADIKDQLKRIESTIQEQHLSNHQEKIQANWATIFLSSGIDSVKFEPVSERLEETIKQISRWLYGSSPEKI